MNISKKSLKAESKQSFGHQNLNTFRHICRTCDLLCIKFVRTVRRNMNRPYPGFFFFELLTWTS